MFNPSQAQVREFFCVSYRKWKERQPLTPLESMAADWIALHPEYHQDLQSLEEALRSEYLPESGRTNPFLHLSMHLSISEQVSIDQPPGIRKAFDSLCEKLGDAHLASHEIVDCLGEIVWRAQRDGIEPDGQAYLDCIERKVGNSRR